MGKGCKGEARRNGERVQGEARRNGERMRGRRGHSAASQSLNGRMRIDAHAYIASVRRPV